MTLRQRFTAADQVRLLELRQDGYSNEVIANMMHRTVGDVGFRLAEMARKYKLPRRKITHRVVENPDAKMRTCQRCQKDFLSEWYGNRRCKRCQGGSPIQEAYQLAAGL